MHPYTAGTEALRRIASWGVALTAARVQQILSLPGRLVPGIPDTTGGVCGSGREAQCLPHALMTDPGRIGPRRRRVDVAR